MQATQICSYNKTSFLILCIKGIVNINLNRIGLFVKCVCHHLRSRAAGAASQCYQNDLMLLQCKIMLFKCQINTNTNKNGFLHPKKCLERVLKCSYLVSIVINYQFSKTMFTDFFVLILDFDSISSHFNSIISHFNSISSNFNTINSSQQH